MQVVLVPLMLLVSSVVMAFAWLGHLKFKQYGYFSAVALSWLLVLPEYMLNVGAIRYGHGAYSGAQMASFNLCTGVLCVALVARFFLGEDLARHQIIGFGLMAVAIVLITYRSPEKPATTDKPQSAVEQAVE